MVLASLGFQLWLGSSGGTAGSLWGTVFTMLSGFLVLGAGAVYVRLSSKRVQSLLRGLDAARKGQYPLLVAQGDDEIAQLTVGFNQIVQELRARRESLTDLVDTRETELVQLTQNKPAEKGHLEGRLESLGENVIVLDMDGHVIMANKQVSETLGLPASVLSAAPLERLIEQVEHRLVNRPVAEQALRDLRAGKQAIGEMVLELDAAGGTAIRLYAAPVRGADSAMLGRIATLMDLGREREVERLKSEFMSTISHELRTPITSVKGALGLIRSGAAGQISTDMRELLEIASTNIDRLINVINNILDVLTLERGQAGFRFAPTSVGDCVMRAAAMVSGQSQQSGVNIVNNLPRDLPGVRGDARRIEQVMVNLLSNAIKFSRQGQTVFVAAAAENGHLKVSVRDSGKGISREAIGRLFQKFEHSEEALTRGYQGAGLGLAICRHIVEGHGGRIWVDSVEGSGSTFWFTLPVETQEVDPTSFRRNLAERAGGLA
jgi:two-component system, OmpR family, sensor histidine kinase VicK